MKKIIFVCLSDQVLIKETETSKKYQFRGDYIKKLYIRKK